jgi:hypothetical protein
LFAAQVLVVLVGAVTLGLVAAAIGPAIFRGHLRQASADVGADAAGHVEEAYASASGYVARRVARPVGQLAAAAADVADGQYQARLAPPGMGPRRGTPARPAPSPGCGGRPGT